LNRLFSIVFILLLTLIVTAYNPLLGDMEEPSVVSYSPEEENQNIGNGEDRPIDEPDKPLSQENLLIDVSISEQKVRIYDNNILKKEWIVSTGRNDSTPLGMFFTQNRGEWFFSDKYQQGAKWWVSFKDYGVYLFHSVPMDRQMNIIVEEQSKLGTPSSHGCVRLEVDAAKWIYDNIPEGTAVYIHN
jgi:hypothetical protein